MHSICVVTSDIADQDIVTGRKIKRERMLLAGYKRITTCFADAGVFADTIGSGCHWHRWFTTIGERVHTSRPVDLGSTPTVAKFPDLLDFLPAANLSLIEWWHARTEQGVQMGTMVLAAGLAGDNMQGRFGDGGAITR